MKTIPTLLGAILLPATVQAAITITVSPTEAGTRFGVTQTSPNPPVPLDQVTVGNVPFIGLAESSLSPDFTETEFTGDFDLALGILTELNGAGSSPVTGLRFFRDPIHDGFQPALVLEEPIELGPGRTHRLDFTAGESSSLPLDFDNFVPGTHVESNPAFGEVTTVVVPEPTAVTILAALAPGLMLRRRS